MPTDDSLAHMAIQEVFEPRATLGDVYTVGMNDLGMPELVALGVSRAAARLLARMFNLLAQRVKDGHPVEARQKAIYENITFNIVKPIVDASEKLFARVAPWAAHNPRGFLLVIPVSYITADGQRHEVRPGELRVCDGCELVFKKVLCCATCQTVYCSRECQATAWPRHRDFCRRVRDEGAHWVDVKRRTPVLLKPGTPLSGFWFAARAYLGLPVRPNRPVDLEKALGLFATYIAGRAFQRGGDIVLELDAPLAQLFEMRVGDTLSWSEAQRQLNAMRADAESS